MDETLRQMLKIPYDRLDDINAVLLDPDIEVVNNFLEVVEKIWHAGGDQPQRPPRPRQLPNLLKKVEQTQPEYLKDLKWLAEQRDRGAFISVADYRRKVLGDQRRTA